MAEAGIIDFIKIIPKVELHVHIEGTLTPSLRIKLAKKHGIILLWSTAEELEAHYRGWWGTVVRGEADLREAGKEFFDLYFGGHNVLRDGEDYYELAMEFFSHAASANVRYMEIFFNPQVAVTRGISADTVIAAYKRAKMDAEEDMNIHCQFILAALRTGSLASAFEMRATEDGFLTTAHVDSNLPNQHTYLHEILTKLGGHGLNRIDHGACVGEFSDLVDIMKKNGQGITCCPEVSSGIYSGQGHQRRFFEGQARSCFDAGVLISIGSDDPPYFRFTWVQENLFLIQEK